MNKYYARKGEYGELLTGPEVMYQACVNNEFIASACLSVVKRSFIEKHEIRFIPNILHEDNPYTFEILLKSKSVLVLKDKFYLRTVRPESITTKKKTIRNVWGYYVSFQKTQELLRSLHNRELLTEDQALAFQKISFSFLRFAQNIWKNIPYPRLFLSFIQKDQRIVFEKLIATIEMNTTQLNLVKESQEYPLDYYSVNVEGTINLLKTMETFGVRNLIFSSTATVYGENEGAPVTEKDPINPINNYGKSKRMVEIILESLAKADPRWNFCVLRYFNPVGAHPSGLIGENPNGVPANLMPFISQVAIGKRKELFIYGNDYPTRDGTGARDYIHVLDLAEAHLAALKYLEHKIGFYWNW